MGSLFDISMEVLLNASFTIEWSHARLFLTLDFRLFGTKILEMKFKFFHRHLNVFVLILLVAFQSDLSELK